MPIYEQFKLGKVQSMHFGLTGPAGLYYGFGIINQHGAPMLTISYLDVAEAKAAHDALASILETAVVVSTSG